MYLCLYFARRLKSVSGLKLIRSRYGIRVEYLAKYMGVSNQLLVAWENGERGIPRKYQKMLSHFFGSRVVRYCNLSEIIEL